MLQEQVDWFESWFGSPYYHILYQNRDLDEARDFVEKLLGYLKPAAGSKMVDIACGEGRYSLQLAKHGFDVTGLDLSSESIHEAQKHESKQLHFFVHDMRFPFYINYFHYAFNFFTSFGYFAHDRDHHMAAKSFAKCLRTGGRLVIDYLNREKAASNLVAEDKVTKEGIDFNISRKLENNHFIKHIRFTDENGTSREFTESVAAFTQEDFVTIFKKAGLTLENTFGDYQLHEYDAANSPRMIMIFKK
ncbi:MAG TPA: class I SAM-dependent methyltransferase [Flavipsychrobacter sp.]|nr:class I SAM-dependent methyltransferase [Flavipsychrobacter sp.]